MEPFSKRNYRPDDDNQIYVTRNMLPVRILCTDRKGGLPIVGLFTDERGVERYCCWDWEGRSFVQDKHPHDLFIDYKDETRPADETLSYALQLEKADLIKACENCNTVVEVAKKLDVTVQTVTYRAKKHGLSMKTLLRDAKEKRIRRWLTETHGDIRKITIKYGVPYDWIYSNCSHLGIDFKAYRL